MRRGIVFIIVILIALIYAPVFLAEAAEVEGFRDLKWGMTVDQAKNVYKNFIIVEKPEYKTDVGETVYNRENENYIINNVKMDHITYSFKNDKFYKVAAGLNPPVKYSSNLIEDFESKKSGIGSVIGAYSDLKKAIEGKYGQPSSEEKKIGQQSNAKWYVKDVIIELGYLNMTIEGIPLRNTRLKIENLKVTGKKSDF